MQPPPPSDDIEPDRPVHVRLDPTLDHRGSPLRRALRRAGLCGPFGLGQPSTDNETPDQENQSP